MTRSDPFAYFDEARAEGGASLLIDDAFETLAGGASAEDAAFVLLDDAGGRFVVDPRTGLICLADEERLNQERDSVHAVRLQARDGAGEPYEMTLRLKLTGVVPEIVDADETLDAPVETPAPVEAVDMEASSLSPWRDFAAFLGRTAHAPSPNAAARFGEACDFGLEERFDLDAATLSIGAALPAPASDAAWN